MKACNKPAMKIFQQFTKITMDNNHRFLIILGFNWLVFKFISRNFMANDGCILKYQFYLFSVATSAGYDRLVYLFIYRISSIL
jgi:hypothetical protein